MSHPMDVKSLAKFLPCLSDMAHPLCQLIRKNTEWAGLKYRSDIKTAITQTLVLHFYTQ